MGSSQHRVRAALSSCPQRYLRGGGHTGTGLGDPGWEPSTRDLTTFEADPLGTLTRRPPGPQPPRPATPERARDTTFSLANHLPPPPTFCIPGQLGDYLGFCVPCL